MRWVTKTAVAAICFAGWTTVLAAPAGSGASAAKPSLDEVLGKRLVAIDGSAIELTASEGGMAREIEAANGALQVIAFTFVNDRLGTLVDSRDPRTVIGVFRKMPSDLEIHYADGSSEIIAANDAGGLLVETRPTGKDAYCTSWYPEGHEFSLDERKAALAQYAARLGIDEADKTGGGAGCAMGMPARAMQASAKSDAPAMTAAMAVVPAGAAAAAAPEAAAAMTAATAMPTAAASASAPKTADVAADAAINVRTSDVKPIDPPAAGATTAAANATPGGAASSDGQPRMLASAIPPAMPTAARADRGASNCLAVESDGSHWGFRNRCGYTVQFAYCLMSGARALVACKDGSVPGSVAGNGFGALVTDETLTEQNASHDFRWVACQGGAGEVIARMDQSDPPSGRCVY